MTGSPDRDHDKILHDSFDGCWGLTKIRRFDSIVFDFNAYVTTNVYPEKLHYEDIDVRE